MAALPERLPPGDDVQMIGVDQGPVDIEHSSPAHRLTFLIPGTFPENARLPRVAAA
jgi:hypothetical protein